MNKRTYREKKHGPGMVARMNRVGEDVVHVFVEHRGPWRELDDFNVEGGFFEAMKYLNRRYGCAWERCNDKLFTYD